MPITIWLCLIKLIIIIFNNTVNLAAENTGRAEFTKFLQPFHGACVIERLKHRGKSATITFELCEDPWTFYCQKGAEMRKK